MKTLFGLLGIILISAGNLYAQKNKELIDGISISPENGRLSLPSESRMAFTCISPGWEETVEQNNANTSFSAKDIKENGAYLKGELKIWEGPVSLEEEISVNPDKSLDCSWSVASDRGINCEAVYTILKLPPLYTGTKIFMDEQEIELPLFKKTVQNLKFFSNVKKITIPVELGKITVSGKLSGLLMVSAAGDPPWTYYGLRFYASPGKGLIKNASVKFTVRREEITSEVVDISKAVNSTFIDETAGDRKGGWTDQGHETDLRALKPGRVNLGGINFNIIDSAGNNGKSCIVLKGSARDYFPSSATIDMAGGKYKKLYLLHASAWSSKNKEAGTVQLNYSDGSADAFPVVCGIDVEDWARGTPLENAVPVWSGDSAAFGKATLYLSAFPLQNKELKNIVLGSGNGPVWMLASLSVSDDDIAPLQPLSESVTYCANEEWLAIDWDPMKTIPGSPIDLSGTTEKPAGKYGDVYCDGNRFCFKGKPGTALRFYGGHITHELPYMTQPQAEKFAAELAALGYNSVRFHCYIKGMSKNDGSPQLDPEGLDKFCYLLYCLKRNGIYYTFPLNGNTGWGTVIVHDPEIPEFDGRIKMTELEGLTPVSDVARKWLEDFAKNLLLHVNPYTKTMIKDDPALISVEIQNENTFYQVFQYYPDFLDKVYSRKCAEYLQQEKHKEPSADEVENFLPEFLVIMQQKGTRELTEFLREIGVTKPITDVSNRTQIALALTREHLDYVDCHAYWDLAEGLPSFPHLRNPIQAQWMSQIGTGATRLFGKPFAVGEYNTVYPSPYWAYIGPSESALAGLQDWSLIQMCMMNVFIKEVFNPAPAIGIKSFNPMILLTERIGTMLYKNGLVRPSEVKIPFVVTREYIYRNLNIKGAPEYPRNYSALGLCCQIGTVLYDNDTDLSAYPCVIVPKDMEIPAPMEGITYFRADAKLYDNLREILPGLGDGVFKSTTGQTVLDSRKKSFAIMTPGAECFMLPKEQSAIEGKSVSISENDGISTSFVGALDEAPLEHSKHLLALYVTDIKNTGTVVEYRKSGSGIFRKIGKMPFLLKQGDAVVTVESKNSGLPRIWALRYDGSRKVPVKAEKTSGGFSFTARAVTEKDTYFAYEISWE